VIKVRWEKMEKLFSRARTRDGVKNDKDFF
jgi:hypothetical protein